MKQRLVRVTQGAARDKMEMRICASHKRQAVFSASRNRLNGETRSHDSYTQSV